METRADRRLSITTREACVIALLLFLLPSVCWCRSSLWVCDVTGSRLAGFVKGRSSLTDGWNVILLLRLHLSSDTSVAFQLKAKDWMWLNFSGICCASLSVKKSFHSTHVWMFFLIPAKLIKFRATDVCESCERVLSRMLWKASDLLSSSVPTAAAVWWFSPHVFFCRVHLQSSVSCNALKEMYEDKYKRKTYLKVFYIFKVYV